MKKRILSAVIMVVMIISIFSTMTFTASAAGAGTMMSNAVEAKFGTKYMKIWTRGNDHLNHYVKFVVENQGIVNINATKTFDDEGEYGKMEFTVYNEYGEGIWCNGTYKAVDNARDYYSMNVGLAPGTYYLTILPKFYVTSGLIETYYTLDFEENAYCEIEPNDSGAKATPIDLNKKYIGYFSKDGSGDYEEADYFKFNIESGRTYRIKWYDFEKLDRTTTIVDLLTPDGDVDYIKIRLADKIDTDGINYYEFTADCTGTAYIHIYNDSGHEQYNYGFVVKDMTCEKEGHAWGKWKTTKKATCTKAGSKERVCTSCDEKDTEKIKATGHSWNKGVTVKPATFESAGKKKFTCTVCGEVKNERIAKKAFKDVAKGSWYKAYVDYAVINGIFNGTSETTFTPNATMTRAQFVQVFANISGVDTSNNKINSGFKDVNSGEWYAAAVKWAAKNGVVSGVGDGKFAPNAPVTREQMCVMLVNYVEKFQKASLEKVEKKANFKDDKNISSWAKKEVYKCQMAKLISGTGKGSFEPKATANRAVGATIFTDFHKLYIAK